MNLQQAFLAEHSLQQSKFICNYLLQNSNKIPEFFDCVFSDNKLISQRSAWVLRFLAEANPNIFRPYISKLVSNLSKPNHDAVIRNTLSVLEKVDYPEELLGEIFDKSIHFLQNAAMPHAIRAFAMTCALKVVLQFPELKNELKSIVEEAMIFGSPAIISRGKKTLKQLNKM